MSADPSSSSSCRSLVSLGLRSQPSSQSSISDADKGVGLQYEMISCVIYSVIICITYVCTSNEKSVAKFLRQNIYFKITDYIGFRGRSNIWSCAPVFVVSKSANSRIA